MVDILKLRKMNESPQEENPEESGEKEATAPPGLKPEVIKPDETNQVTHIDSIGFEKEVSEASAVKAEAPKHVAPPELEPKPTPNPASEAIIDETPVVTSKSGGDDQDQNVVDLVVFTLDGRLFGVDIIKVQEVVRFTEITRVPNAAEFVLGVMNLRGNITPVIDLHKRFSLQEASWTDKTRIIVLQIKDQAIGFLVDHVSEIMHPLESDIESTSSVHANIGTDYISGVVKIRDGDENDRKLLILLNLEKIFDEGAVALS